MKDATYIKVKEGKLLVSDMVKPSILVPKYYNNHSIWKQAMEAFDQSFVEVGNPELIQDHLRLHFDGDGLNEISGLQFEVEWHNPCIKLGKCKIADKDNNNNCAQLHRNRCQEERRVAILSLKQEQPQKAVEPAREQALAWWDKVELPKQVLLSSRYFNRTALSLTGREIEEIWRKENKKITVEGEKEELENKYRAYLRQIKTPAIDRGFDQQIFDFFYSEIEARASRIKALEERLEAAEKTIRVVGNLLKLLGDHPVIESHIEAYNKLKTLKP